jgi:cytochrome c553
MTLTLALVGCIGPNAEDVEERHDRTVVEMQRHDAEATRMRAAVIDGDLTKVREAAAELRARLPLEIGGTRVDGLQERLKSVTNQLAHAETIDGAAGGMGELAVACGSCHGQVGIRPPPASDMPNGEDWESAMARHSWAADEMWTGLLWKNDARFQHAVEVWNATPLAQPHTAEAKRFVPEVLAMEDRVHDLAQEAAAKMEPNRRGELYGRMLATCSACHTLVRRR